uniref:Uncharacterized protein n=1 Tax=Triticum urartu TaxID=4572 RepID=A0A8R7QEH4_TRIUA
YLDKPPWKRTPSPDLTNSQDAVQCLCVAAGSGSPRPGAHHRLPGPHSGLWRSNRKSWDTPQVNQIQLSPTRTRKQVRIHRAPTLASSSDGQLPMLVNLKYTKCFSYGIHQNIQPMEGKVSN